MTSAIITPTYLDYIDFLYTEPITGELIIAPIVYSLDLGGYEVAPLNNDPRYQKRVINYIETKLKEKWLYKDVSFERLLKYFTADKKKDKITIDLVPSVEKLNHKTFDKEERKYIFRFIEKYFITKKFIRKVIETYIRHSHANWFDLITSSDLVKELMATKIEKMIRQAIYKLSEQKTK